MNVKRSEITQLETLYDTKIVFDFDNHYSLHEPSIEANTSKKEFSLAEEKDKSKTTPN